MSEGQTPAGWYHAEGDPSGTYRQWDGSQWIGEPMTPEASGIPGPGSPPGTTPYPTATDPGTYTARPFGTAPQLITAGSRIGGRLIDIVVWFVAWLVANWPIISQTFSEIMDAAQEGRDPVEIEIGLGTALVTSLANLVLIVGYEVFMNTRFGGTFGKKAISARIVKEDGSDIDTRTAVMRMVPYLAIQAFGFLMFLAGSTPGGWLQILLVFLVGLAGLIMLFTDDRHQTPWDKLAKTLVVVR